MNRVERSAFTSNGSTETFYSAVHRVFYKCDRNKDLNLHIILAIKQNVVSLRVTDDEDPYFLYSLVMTENDFQRIKEKQSLLIDFENFPKELVKLLEQCKSDMAPLGPQHLLIVENERGDASGTAHLKILERNLFRHICHLSLKIVCGTDADIMALMTTEIKKLKDENACRTSELAYTASKLEGCVVNLEFNRLEAGKLYQQWSEEKTLLIKSNDELKQENAALLAARLQLQEDEQRKKINFEAIHESAIQKLQIQVSELSAQNKALFEKNCEEENSKREKCGELEFYKNERDLQQIEITKLEKKNSKLESDYQEKAVVAAEQKTRLSALLHEIKDNNVILKKQQELLKTINDQKVQFEEGFREKEIALERKQLTLNKVSEELLKANEILARLQAELDAVKFKLNNRTQIAMEQERQLYIKTQKLAESIKNFNDLREKMEAAVAKEMTATELLAAANKKISTLEKEVLADKTVMEKMVHESAQTNCQKSQNLAVPMDLDFKICASSRQNLGLQQDEPLPQIPQSYGTGLQHTAYQQPPVYTAPKADTANEKPLKSHPILESFAYQQPGWHSAQTKADGNRLPNPNVAYQQHPQHAGARDNAKSNMVPKSSSDVRLAAYQQPPRHVDIAAPNRMPNSNVRARLTAYQQPPRHVDIAAPNRMPNSNVQARLTAYQQPPRHGEDGTSNMPANSNNPNMNARFNQQPPKNAADIRLQKTKFVVTQQPPVASAYFPKKG